MRQFTTSSAILVGLVCCARCAMSQTCGEWTRVSTSGPQSRFDHATAYDSGRAVTVLYGGSYGDAFAWEWDGVRWTNNRESGLPGARNRHALVYDDDRGVTILFGGWGLSSYKRDTWNWDGVQWREVATTGPVGRYSHAMAFDGARSVAVLFGGWNGSYLGDTWEWDGSEWVNVANVGPSPRTEHAMVYDSARGVTVLFGGRDATGQLGDTWEWDGFEWSLVATTGPHRRYGHAMAFDSNRRRTVLFGGFDGEYKGDTWEWDGRQWTQTASFGPSARRDHAVAYESARGVTILFGGYDGNEQGDTWTYSCTAPILTVDATCPTGGPILIQWLGATPSGQAALLFALGEGNFVIPNNRPCAGTILGLGSNQLRIAWQGASNSSGEKALNANAGSGACGGYLQLLDLPTCGTSNVARIE